MKQVVLRSLLAAAITAAAPHAFAEVLFRSGSMGEGIPAGGPYVPPGGLYDNEQSNGITSLASQDSSGTLTARTADDFLLDGANCSSGEFDITQIRIQMVQADAAAQSFAVDLYADNGAGTAPTPAGAITPIATLPQTSQSALGTFGVGTTIFEASFVPANLVLQANTVYWISGYGTNAAANAAAFNNFFAASNGSGATTDNGVIIAPGAGVANWTPVDTVIGPPAQAFSFAIDGTCRAAALPQQPVPFSPQSWLLLLGVIGLLGGLAAWRRNH
jgi:hypothetical protein